MPFELKNATRSQILSKFFAWQDPATSKERHARLQICASFIRIAKAADKSILPHMKVLNPCFDSDMILI